MQLGYEFVCKLLDNNLGNHFVCLFFVCFLFLFLIILDQGHFKNSVFFMILTILIVKIGAKGSDSTYLVSKFTFYS